MPPETPRTGPRVFILNGEGHKMGVYHATKIEGPLGYLERVKVYEASTVDAERERMLDLLERWEMANELDRSAHEETVKQTRALLAEHGRLPKEERTNG